MTLFLLLGCQDIDLAQEWDLDRLRLVAVRAEPAEPRPGDLVTFTSIGYAPEGEWSALWFACVQGSPDGCSFDASLLEGIDSAEDIAALTPEEQAELLAALQAAGLIGFQPGFEPAWVVPEDSLAGLTEAEALEGTSATVQVTLTTEADIELVLRRIPISLAPTPNLNPDIGTFEVDGISLAAGGGLRADAGQLYELEAGLLGELETYEYVNTDGEHETRTEELEWRWYTDMGHLDGSFDIEDPEPTADAVVWRAPSEPGTGVIHAVVLDGRGGMGWWSVVVTVE